MWLFLAILAVPLIEIGLFVEIGGAIGLWPTLIWVVLSAALGIIVLKGVASLGPLSLSRNMAEMQDPLSPLANRLMVVIAGGLLVLPGFLTDSIGLVLLVPPLRKLVIRLAGRRLRRQHAAATGTSVIDGDWREVDPAAPPPPQTGNTPSDWTRH